MPSSQQILMKFKGISSFSNPLNPQVVIDGSLLEGLNIVIDRNEVAEPRRGFFQYGNTFGVNADRTKQLINYKDTILRHVLSNIQYDYAGKTSFKDFDYFKAEHNGLSDVIKAIGYAKTDENIQGISILNNESSLGMAQIKALRDALEDFKTSKKYF